jgi:hypothetical protein
MQPARAASKSGVLRKKSPNPPKQVNIIRPVGNAASAAGGEGGGGAVREMDFARRKGWEAGEAGVSGRGAMGAISAGRRSPFAAVLREPG